MGFTLSNNIRSLTLNYGWLHKITGDAVRFLNVKM
jgi:hypothetical protein